MRHQGPGTTSTTSPNASAVITLYRHRTSEHWRVRLSRVALAAVMGAAALLLPERASGFACLWTGATSTNWATASNWSTCNSTTPQSSDTATINSGGNQPTLSNAATVGQITLGTGATLTVGSGGTLTMNNGVTGGGDLTVNSGGTLTWVGGTAQGTGVMNVSSGANLNISGATSLIRTLTNAGTGTMTTSGYMYIYTGGAFNNSGTFEVQNDQGFYVGSAGVIVTNSGTFSRTTSSGTFSIGPIFNNSGTVNVQSGTLALSGGGTCSGTFDFTGNTLLFNGGTWTMTAAFTGNILTMSTGTVSFSGAATLTSINQINISGATVNFNTAGGTITPTNLTLTGGTLAGSNNFTFVSGGTFTWTGGQMTGTGTTTVAAGRNLLINGGVSLYRPLVNAGTGTMATSGYMYIYTGGSFNNSGTFEIQNDQGIYLGNAGVIFTNSGTINRTTTSGTASINTVFNNTGTVNVQSGTLSLTGGGTCSGTFDFTGFTLHLSGGTWTMTATFTGNTLTMSSGTVSFSGAATLTSITQMNISGATVNFNTAGGTITPTNLTLTGGTLAGSNNITFVSGGTFTWTGGQMTGTGTTTVAAGRNLLINGGVSLYRPLVNAGTGTMATSGYMYIYTGGSFNNSGTFEIQNDQGIYLGNAGVIFTNSGTINRTTTSGTASINTVFNNTGTVNVQSGTLSLTGGGTCSGTFDFTGFTLLLSGGTWTMTAAFTGNTLTMSSGTVSFSGAATLTSITQMNISGATVNFNTAGGTVTPTNLTLTGGTLAGSNNVTLVSGGTFTWTGGQMSGTGTTTVGAGRTLLINGGVSLYRTLANAGTGTMSGSGYTYIYTGGSFNNSGTFEIQNDQGFYLGNAGVIVTNSGTLSRTTSSGTANIGPVFNNTGTVSVQSGTLSLTGGGTCSGTFDFTGNTLLFNGGTWTMTAAFTGNTLTMSSGTITFNTGATFTITQMTISGATVNVNTAAALNQGNFTITSGTLSGTANVNIVTAAALKGGTLSGTGTFTIPNLVTATVDTTAVTMTRPFSNSGAMTFKGNGYLYMNTGGTFTNTATGTIDIQHDTYAFYGATGSLPFSNAGSITRTTGSGTASIYNVAFTNTGIVESQSGTLGLSTYTQTAGQTIMSGGNLSTNSTTMAINGGILKGTGTITGNVSCGTAGKVAPGLSPGSITITGNYTQTTGGTLEVELNGATTPGTDYDQLVVTGTVSLGGNLSVITNFTPPNYTNFTIIDNGGVDAVTGNFVGLVEGTVLVTPQGNYRVSYLGGSGNDVVLTYLAPTQLYTVQPCRVANTTAAGAGFPAGYGPPSISVGAGNARTFTIAGAPRCGIPASAQAVTFNFTVVNPTNTGDLRIYPAGPGISAPLVSTMNYSAGQTRANNAIVLLGPTGGITIQADGAGTVDVLIDVTGYLQ